MTELSSNSILIRRPASAYVTRLAADQRIVEVNQRAERLGSIGISPRELWLAELAEYRQGGVEWGESDNGVTK